MKAYTLKPDDRRPPTVTGVYVDGVEMTLRARRSGHAYHRPDPEYPDDPRPTCRHRPTVAGWVYMPVDVAHVWRTPCKRCFPDHYDVVTVEEVPKP